jgi:hypothetical protein
MPVRRAMLLLLVLAAAAPAAAVKLKTLKGDEVAGELVSVSSKEIVVAKTTVPFDQVLMLDFGQPVGELPKVPWTDVELNDGTMLHCAKFSVVKNQVKLTLVSGQTAEFPLDSVANVLANANVEKNRTRWNEILDNKRPTDVLAILSKDDKGNDVINPVPGTIGAADAKGETIEFKRSNNQVETVDLKKVAGMVFNRKPNANAAPVQCKLLDLQRNVVYVSGVEPTATGFTVTTPEGVKIDFTPALVSKMDYAKGKLEYLSEMDPAKVVETCVLAEDFIQHYRRNASLEDKPIRVNNVQYEKGLALHAYTELVYDLKGEYREFSAVVGIDDNVGGHDRPVQLLIEGDGQELVKLTLTRKDKEKAVPVLQNIKDVKKLRVVVRRLPGGELHDLGIHLDLADAKVSK